MAVENNGGGGKKRRPSFHRRIYQRTYKGTEIAQAWPRPRGKSLQTQTREQMEWFRQAQWATKYWPAFMQKDIAAAVKGTPLMPRDFMTMIMAGRAFIVQLEDGRRIYPMAGVNDVSLSLDVISQTVGSMMARGPAYWQPIEGGDAGFLLTSNGPDQIPSWQPGPSGPAVQPWTLLKRWDFATDGAVADVPALVAAYQDVMICFQGVTSVAASLRAVEISTDNGVTWHQANGNYQQVGAAGTLTSTPAWYLHTTANNNPRWGIISIFNLRDNSGPKFGYAAATTQSIFTASNAPITNVRACARTATTNLNGGVIQIWGR